ncbi:TPA: hypothetical protein ACNFPT_004512 [Enterobacter ludwigii]
MRKSFKILTGIVVLIAVALIWAWPYASMEFAGSAHYTQQDRREYEFYTPELLKNMPRISPRYDFDFANVSGPASHVYTVRYYDVTDASRIDAYLESVGYTKQKDCHIEAECWLASDPQETVTVSTLDSKAVQVSVIYNF